jgi:hypothetical protein
MRGRVIAAVAWQLEIHHIDVQMTGDATLIIAREVPPLAGLVARVRSALIDGGRKDQWADLDAYIGAQIGGNTLSVLIVTHYCIDHLNGVTQLLLQQNRYADTYIYDQGWPGGNLSNDYIKYVRAINGRNQNKKVLGDAHWEDRTRVTLEVRADNMAPTISVLTDIGLPATPDDETDIDQAPTWLLGGAGAPAEILWNGAGGIPAGAPRMRFIAANRYVRTPLGGITAAVTGIGNDPRNEKSLAVEVTFGNFRYYVAGDIETAQESSIRVLLNNTNDAAGRVPAVKLSHHGSKTATSRAFIDRLRPEAAFISCGTANSLEHPHQDTINVLDGFIANPTGVNPAPPHANVPPPNRPISHYLTGYQIPFPLAPAPAAPPPESLQGTAGFTAGDPNLLATQPGHIVVTVTAAQAVRDRRGGLYLGVAAAANRAATNLAVAGPMAAGPAATAAQAAAEAAQSFGAAEAASAFLTSTGRPVAALAAATAATTAVTGGQSGQLTAAAVTTAAMGAGAPAGPAAGAGAAAGVVVGGVDGGSLADAVRGALAAAGLGVGAAAAAGTAAAGLAANPGGLFNVAYYSIGAAGNENVAEI